MAAETICVHLKRIAGDRLTLQVAPDISIEELKAKIAEQLGEEVAATERQRLIYQGKVMKANTKLSDYEVADGHTVHLVMRPVGAPARSANNPPNPASNPASNPLSGAAGPNPSVVFSNQNLPNGGQVGVMMMSMANSLQDLASSAAHAASHRFNPSAHASAAAPPQSGGTNTNSNTATGAPNAAQTRPANAHDFASAVLANTQNMVQRMMQHHQQVHQQRVNAQRQQQQQQQQQQRTNAQQPAASSASSASSAPTANPVGLPVVGSLLAGLSNPAPFANTNDPSVTIAQFQASLGVINASLAQLNSMAADRSATRTPEQLSWLRRRRSDLATSVAQLGHHCHLVSHILRREAGNPINAPQSSTTTTTQPRTTTTTESTAPRTNARAANTVTRSSQSSTTTTVVHNQPETTTTTTTVESNQPETTTTTTTVESTQPETTTTTTTVESTHPQTNNTAGHSSQSSTTTTTVEFTQPQTTTTAAAAASSNTASAAEIEIEADVEVEIEDLLEDFEDIYD